MYHILLQLKKHRDRDRGEVWATSFKKFPPNDSLEQFLERENAEIIARVKSLAAVRSLMNKMQKTDFNRSEMMDYVRKFFNEQVK
jgi:hypothetical protein